MRKPVSKHALRRALEQAQREGLVQWSEPTGAVVDRVFHLISREALDGKPISGESRADAARRQAAAV